MTLAQIKARMIQLQESTRRQSFTSALNELEIFVDELPGLIEALEELEAANHQQAYVWELNQSIEEEARRTA
ncbi:hypothetical protein [Paenibacillus oleatilyticus]|uniref:Uncharacterized protein n=1 Tax=Paenibacillus oleatilyticus TaxID=2594886 RepID=A0ABV4VCD7_9BACL